MNRVAFKMKLFEGREEEYKRRHDELWPELKILLKQSGIFDYSIYLDEETSILFGSFKVTDKSLLDNLPQHPVMKRWWQFMKDMMETNKDASPVSKPLREVFYLD